MPDQRVSSPDQPITADQASVLRHDLITPINLIIGYCELLGGESWGDDAGEVPGSIRDIRQHGLALLRSIDQALLDHHAARSTADLRRLGELLERPATLVVAASDRFCAPPDGIGLTEEVRDDFERIRAAGRQMLGMARRLEAGDSSLGSEDEASASVG